jgi:hypothetical protein
MFKSVLTKNASSSSRVGETRTYVQSHARNKLDVFGTGSILPTRSVPNAKLQIKKRILDASCVRYHGDEFLMLSTGTTKMSPKSDHCNTQKRTSNTRL